jgi:hypothetical protein
MIFFVYSFRRGSLLPVLSRETVQRQPNIDLATSRGYSMTSSACGIKVPKSLQPLNRNISAHSLLPEDFACQRAERPLASKAFTSAKY